MAADPVLRTSVVGGRPHNNTISQYIYVAAISRAPAQLDKALALLSGPCASSTMSPPPLPEPLIETLIRSSGETPLVSCRTTSPNATGVVRSNWSGVAVIVISLVSPRPPLKVKLLGETAILNPGVIALPEAVQRVAWVRAFRLPCASGAAWCAIHVAHRREVQRLRIAARRGVRGNEVGIVSSITRPASAALVRSSRPLPTSSASH